jgi:glyoxylase-like metal-dependent hydrolase (beta-lactamase superfamily II)
LREGDVLILGNTEIHVIETPGHTPGHVSFYVPSQKLIFVGDTLFDGSIGRTDFPGGSYEQLITSVRTKIFPLGDDVTVYPGHGPATTVGKERRTNPFF